MAEETNVALSEEPKEAPKSEEEVLPPPTPKHKKIRISLPAFLISAVALMLAAVMITYTACASVYRRKLAEAQLSGAVMGTDGEEYYGFDLFKQFIEYYSFGEVDQDAMMAAALRAYVASTGDPYADYYTEEEFAALQADSAGLSVGIGVNVVNSTVEIGGVVQKSIHVVNVMRDSPAQEKGIKVGDDIIAIGIGDNAEFIKNHDLALEQLRGDEGTTAEFLVYREGETEFLEFSIPRRQIITSSVYFHVHAVDPTVGVVKIEQFDLTTPTQFTAAMETLISYGCTKFVFDVRYNPGGDLLSIEAVLSYFLEEGDVLIRIKTAAGEESQTTVGATFYEGRYQGCSVRPEDIGKYREIGGKPLQAVVLCNGGTASAAELFTATFRDYGIAPTVGTTTFGKGSMQSLWDLSTLGYKGALKLTTAKYFSAKDENGYDGVGISPDVVEELSEEAAKQNVYEIADADDNQLAKAVELLNQ